MQAGCQVWPWRGRRIRGWPGDGLDVYACFNNDRGGHAPRNARDLRRFASGR